MKVAHDVSWVGGLGEPVQAVLGKVVEQQQPCGRALGLHSLVPLVRYLVNPLVFLDCIWVSRRDFFKTKLQEKFTLRQWEERRLPRDNPGCALAGEASQCLKGVRRRNTGTLTGVTVGATNPYTLEKWLRLTYQGPKRRHDAMHEASGG